MPDKSKMIIDKQKVEAAVEIFRSSSCAKILPEDAEILFSLAQAYLNGEIEKEADLTAAYMTGFEKGKDSVKLASVEEIEKILNDREDINNKAIYAMKNRLNASALVGKVRKEGENHAR